MWTRRLRRCWLRFRISTRQRRLFCTAALNTPRCGDWTKTLVHLSDYFLTRSLSRSPFAGTAPRELSNTTNDRSLDISTCPPRRTGLPWAPTTTARRRVEKGSLMSNLGRDLVGGVYKLLRVFKAGIWQLVLGCCCSPTCASCGDCCFSSNSKIRFLGTVTRVDGGAVHPMFIGIDILVPYSGWGGAWNIWPGPPGYPSPPVGPGLQVNVSSSCASPTPIYAV